MADFLIYSTRIPPTDNSPHPPQLLWNMIRILTCALPCAKASCVSGSQGDFRLWLGSVFLVCDWEWLWILVRCTHIPSCACCRLGCVLRYPYAWGFMFCDVIFVCSSTRFYIGMWLMRVALQKSMINHDVSPVPESIALTRDRPFFGTRPSRLKRQFFWATTLLNNCVLFSTNLRVVSVAIASAIVRCRNCIWRIWPTSCKFLRVTVVGYVSCCGVPTRFCEVLAVLEKLSKVPWK